MASYFVKRFFLLLVLLVINGAVHAQAPSGNLQDKSENLTDQEKEIKRLENLRRMQGLAAQVGSPVTSYAEQSYAEQIRRVFKSNMQFDWPATTVEIRLKSNGEIIEQKIVKSSGNPSFDEAVLQAISKTQKVPPDKDGRVPPSLIIRWSLN